MGRFIYITGADGTGKSTQAQLLIQFFRDRGIQYRHLWMRYQFFFSLPLLVLARLRGYSWHEIVDEVDHGYWDFRNSLILRFLFPWIFLLDASLAAFSKVYFPIWLGKSIVCERFVLDMLVDLSVALNDRDFYKRLPGRLFLRLLPRDSIILVLDLEIEIIKERRPDLRTDRRLEDRLKTYRHISSDKNFETISSKKSIYVLNEYIKKRTGISDEDN